MLSATYLSARCPIFFAPAMDLDMWAHPSTIQNITRLQSYGNFIIDVGSGELASGLQGPGRLAEPEEILLHLEEYFHFRSDMNGLSVLINAGPTYEAMTGRDSAITYGKKCCCIAKIFESRCYSSLVLGPESVGPDDTDIHTASSGQTKCGACSGFFQQ